MAAEHIDPAQRLNAELTKLNAARSSANLPDPVEIYKWGETPCKVHRIDLAVWLHLGWSLEPAIDPATMITADAEETESSGTDEQTEEQAADPGEPKTQATESGKSKRKS